MRLDTRERTNNRGGDASNYHVSKLFPKREARTEFVSLASCTIHVLHFLQVFLSTPPPTPPAFQFQFDEVRAVTIYGTCSRRLRQQQEGRNATNPKGSYGLLSHPSEPAPSGKCKLEACEPQIRICFKMHKKRNN